MVSLIGSGTVALLHRCRRHRRRAVWDGGGVSGVGSAAGDGCRRLGRVGGGGFCAVSPEAPCSSPV
eukprot:748884-Pyramimonas_sp.AAC.3